jgi:hypothetical protein
LVIIEILPVLIESAAILQSIALVSLAIHKNLIILESFNLIAKLLEPVIMLVIRLIAIYLNIIPIKITNIVVIVVGCEIGVHCAGLVYIYI